MYNFCRFFIMYAMCQFLWRIHCFYAQNEFFKTTTSHNANAILLSIIFLVECSSCIRVDLPEHCNTTTVCDPYEVRLDLCH